MAGKRDAASGVEKARQRTGGVGSVGAMYTRTFSTLGCGELSLDEVIALGARHGLAQFEVRALGGSLDLPAYLAASFGSPASLAAKLSAAGAAIVALDTSFRLIDGSEEERARLLAFVPWAEALGVRWLRVFDGGTTLDTAALARAAETLRGWQSLRRERGWAVDWMIETHDTLWDAERLTRFLAAMPPDSVRLLWDTHHTWKRGGEEPRATWRAIAPHVVHVHVKDSVSEPSGRHPFTYVLPGVGEFPMAPVRAVLAAEFSGAVSLEWERWWHPSLPPLENALRAAEERRWW